MSCAVCRGPVPAGRRVSCSEPCYRAFVASLPREHQSRPERREAWLVAWNNANDEPGSRPCCRRRLPGLAAVGLLDLSLAGAESSGCLHSTLAKVVQTRVEWDEQA